MGSARPTARAPAASGIRVGRSRRGSPKSRLLPLCTQRTLEARFDSRWAGRRRHSPAQATSVEAMAQRPFVRSRNEELHANPVALSEAAHPRPREIRQGLAPGLESLLNRFATFRRLGQVRARHDDTIHVKTPQMVPVPLVDCFKRGVNHAKVLFDGHLDFPLPVSAWKLDYLDGYRCGSLVQPPEGGPDQPPDSPDPKPLGHPSFRSARWWTSGPRSPGYGFVTRRCSP